MVQLQDIQIRNATLEDREKLLEFLLSDFMVNEPISQSLGLTKEESADFFKRKPSSKTKIFWGF